MCISYSLRNTLQKALSAETDNNDKKSLLQSFGTGAKALFKAGCTETEKSMEFKGLD